MDPNVVSTRGLRKEYDDVVALKSLDLDIPAGGIFGLIGPNGAGKSTLLKILATALRPDLGRAEVGGFNVETAPMEVRRRVGFMPDFYAMYEDVTTEDFLTYFALAFGLSSSRAKARTDELLHAVNLDEKRNARVSELSRGMRQRLVFAKTIVHDPPLLLLDEPLSGLDPLARREMVELMRSRQSNGTTIVISSHVLAELSEICTQVGILEKGALRAAGPISEIRAALRGGRRMAVEIVGDPDRARTVLSAFSAVALDPGGPPLRFTFSGERAALAEINAALVAAGIGVISFHEEGGSLEDVYFQISQHEVQ